MTDREWRKRTAEISDLERTLNKLYRCRDLEITNLWQRSVFLGAFIILILTGYGGGLIAILSKEKTLCFIVPEFLHFLGIVLGMLGFTFSVIWILMTKGSKAWYEVYARAITNFEEEYQDELGIPSGYGMGTLAFLDDDMRKQDDLGLYENKKLRNIDSGSYSVSKLNILIGWVFLILWSVIILVHSFSLSYFIFERFRCLCLSMIESISVVLLIIIAFVAPFVVGYYIVLKIKSKSRSGYFTERIKKIEKEKKQKENNNGTGS